MSRHKYPRFDSRRMLSPNTSSMCQAIDCKERADREVFIQFDYMRGNDEFVKCCAKHGESANRNTPEFVEQFPPTAWK